MDSAVTRLGALQAGARDTDSCALIVGAAQVAAIRTGFDVGTCRACDQRLQHGLLTRRDDLHRRQLHSE